MFTSGSDLFEGQHEHRFHQVSTAAGGGKDRQVLVAGGFSFDAETYYPEAMQVLDLRAAEPKWETHTADELRRQDQKGHQSLRERYGKG